MKIPIVSGPLSWLSGKPQLTTTSKSGKGSPSKKSNGVRIWGVLEGPISSEDLPSDLPYFGDEYPSNYLNVCKVEIDGEITTINYWFSEFNDAYAWVQHFNKSVEPIEIAYADSDNEQTDWKQ